MPKMIISGAVSTGHVYWSIGIGVDRPQLFRLSKPMLISTTAAPARTAPAQSMGTLLGGHRAQPEA